MPHLNGIISETLRLHPPVPASSLRDTPPQGLIIAGRYIPGNTTVLVPAYTLGRRTCTSDLHQGTVRTSWYTTVETCFERAHDFIPERWYSKPYMVKHRTAFIPFIIGSYPLRPINLPRLYSIANMLTHKPLRQLFLRWEKPRSNTAESCDCSAGDSVRYCVCPGEREYRSVQGYKGVFYHFPRKIRACFYSAVSILRGFGGGKGGENTPGLEYFYVLPRHSWIIPVKHCVHA